MHLNRFQHWAANRVRARVWAAGEAADSRAGWPGRGGRYVMRLDDALATSWTAGDMTGVDWVLQRVWLRQHARMLPFTILATLMLVLGLNLAEPALTLTAGVGVAFSLRIPGSWYADFQMKLLEDRGLRKLLILRRGKDLPAALLLQEYAFHLLVQEDERTTETIRALRDEWSGTTGSLIEAARVLVKENERP